ncbi:MAG TPA: hypothetical protein VFA70_04795, partial [Dehalococcoidia bacterium]|nr:hypothetical protein [Dehalococcoidia bacterium]
RLRGTISVSGDHQLTSSFDVAMEEDVNGIPTPAPSGASCSSYAQGFGSGRFAGPEVQTSGQRQLYFAVDVTGGYHGPGAYTTAALIRGTASFSIPTSVGNAYQLYRSSNHGSTTVRVAADGSGSVTFVEWGAVEHRAQYTAGFLSGSVSWRCG